MSTDKQMPENALFGAFAPAFEYIVDAAQRSTLFIDILRQRGNQYREYRAAKVPHVLSYVAELVLDGRTFARPVNYLLARIIPPKASRSIQSGVRLSWSIRAQAMVPVSAGSRRTVKSASRSRRAIPATLSGSCQSQCLDRPLRTLREARQSSWRK